MPRARIGLERTRPTRMFALVLALAALMPVAQAQASTGSASGGAQLPDSSDSSATAPDSSPSSSVDGSSGGASYEPALTRPKRTARRIRKERDRPVLASFSVSRTALFAYGQPATVTYQINDRSRYVRVRLAFVKVGSRGALYRYNLGRKRTGVTHSFRWRGLAGEGPAPEGQYHFRLSARDPDGNRLVRSSATVGGAPLNLRDHRFPVAGAHSFGGPDARFGAARPGHRHQGQDITAAEGTPVVAPRAGLITWRAYQAEGAGYYLVLAGQDERYNYVFMHLKSGSILVRQGDQVSTGQPLAQVGSTGESTGPHLHFEIWDGPWYHGGHPIDPLPLLQQWDAYS
jgi:murein DD-endopeptidase MepM/ murein hydrolase activator NlpD